jgi:hypothetical protein
MIIVGSIVEVHPHGVRDSTRWTVLEFSGSGFDDERGRIPADFVHIVKFNESLDEHTNADWVHISWLKEAT